MKTPAGSESGRLAIMAREQAETEGYVFEQQGFEPHYRAIIDSYTRELDPKTYRVVKEGQKLRIGFKGINPVLKSATLARIFLKIGESPRHALVAQQEPVVNPAGDMEKIGSATQRIIAAAQKVRKDATGVFRRSDDPKQ